MLCCFLYYYRFHRCSILWLSELDIFGTKPLGGSLKSRDVDISSKPFSPQGELGSWRFPPDCAAVCLEVGFMARICLSLPTCFSVGFFSFPQCVRVTQIVCGFCSEGIASCVAVCPWKREVQESPMHHLGLFPPSS